MHGINMCKGVGEDSRHEIGHVDIQVGSCICLNVFGSQGKIILGTGSIQDDDAH